MKKQVHTRDLSARLHQLAAFQEAEVARRDAIGEASDHFESIAAENRRLAEELYEYKGFIEYELRHGEKGVVVAAVMKGGAS